MFSSLVNTSLFSENKSSESRELFDDAERSRNSRRIISFSLLTRGTLEIFPLELAEFFFIGSTHKREAVGLNYRRRRGAQRVQIRWENGRRKHKNIVAFSTKVQSSPPEQHGQTSSSTILTRHLADLISFLSLVSETFFSNFLHRDVSSPFTCHVSISFSLLFNKIFLKIHFYRTRVQNCYI